jgi:hypothetical protein
LVFIVRKITNGPSKNEPRNTGIRGWNKDRPFHFFSAYFTVQAFLPSGAFGPRQTSGDTAILSFIATAGNVNRGILGIRGKEMI